jgi:DNA ligase (NAD+)
MQAHIAEADATESQRADAVSHLDALRQRRNDVNYGLYVLDDPTLIDAAYDAHLHELRAPEQQFPELFKPDSPARGVGTRLSASFAQRRHSVSKLTMAIATSAEQLGGCISSTREVICEMPGYVLEQKVDGLR